MNVLVVMQSKKAPSILRELSGVFHDGVARVRRRHPRPVIAASLRNIGSRKLLASSKRMRAASESTAPEEGKRLATLEAASDSFTSISRQLLRGSTDDGPVGVGNREGMSWRAVTGRQTGNNSPLASREASVASVRALSAPVTQADMASHVTAVISHSCCDSTAEPYCVFV
jgi:hypothetical protein